MTDENAAYKLASDDLTGIVRIGRPVVTWLANHGVSSAAMVEPLRDSPAIQLEALAKQEAADLIVAGAFGHGKLREWILGGVTRDLLGQSSRCQLMAH
jgi:nucleotide-binding universal stress UspA family protein